MEMKGSTIIITGAGSGIGRATSIECAKHGANVVCCGRTKKNLDETVELIKETGGNGLAVQTDVTQKEQVDRMVAEVLGHFGHIDILFNNAGSFKAMGSVWETSPETWWNDVTVNLYGSMLCCHAVLPHMMEKNEGILINMSGGGAEHPLPGGSGYGCSKTAILRFSETLAKELCGESLSIYIFTVNPGIVKTGMTEAITASEQGRKWMPSLQEKFDKNLTESPGKCAGTILKLVQNACPEFNGRSFDARTDFKEIEHNRQEIYKNDLLVLRMKY